MSKPRRTTSATAADSSPSALVRLLTAVGVRTAMAAAVPWLGILSLSGIRDG